MPFRKTPQDRGIRSAPRGAQGAKEDGRWPAFPRALTESCADAWPAVGFSSDHASWSRHASAPVPVAARCEQPAGAMGLGADLVDCHVAARGRFSQGKEQVSRSPVSV